MKHKFKFTRLWVASLLLLFGFTTNAWAYETLQNAYVTYNTGGDNTTVGLFDQTTNFGDVSKFAITAFYINCKDNWGAGKTCWNGGALYYNTVNSGAFTEVSNNQTNWKPAGWEEGEYKFYKEDVTFSITNSGKYTYYLYAKVWGNYDQFWNCGGSNYKWTFTILPPSVFQYSYNVSGYGSGSGTSGAPYKVAKGGTLTITVNGYNKHSMDNTDSNSKTQVSWDGGSNWTDLSDGSASTQITVSDLTKHSITFKTRNYNSSASLSSSEVKSETIYYIGTEDPTISLAVSSNEIDLGQTITLTPTPGSVSAGGQTYTYQYSTNGGSSYTNIATGQNAAYVWTPSAAGDYKVRIVMSYQSNTYTSNVVDVTVYNVYSVKINKTWPDKIYLWNDTKDTKNAIYPGEELSDYGEQKGGWWILNISSRWEKMIVSEYSTSNKSADINLSDALCVGLSGAGDDKKWPTTLNIDCPGAPTTTTNNPTSIQNTSVTLSGNVTNNNSAITDYGFYWGTTSACEAMAQVGTSDKSGTYNKSLTGLTAGTTYYYKAYATNAFGTTYGDVKFFTTKYKVTMSKGANITSTTPSTTTYVDPNTDLTIGVTPNTGYGYITWSADPSDKAVFNNDYTKATIKGDVTLSVSVSEILYNVTVVAGAHGSITTGSDITRLGVVQKSIAATADEGYHFDQWTATSNKITFGNSKQSSTTAKAAADGTITANFLPNVYTITYKDQGDVAFSGSHETGYPTTHTYDTETTLKSATKIGYEFLGWFDNSGCTGTARTTIGAQEITANLTLYAKWQINTYTLNLPDTTTAGGERVCNFKIDSVKPAPVDGKYNYNTPIQVYLSPKDGYRLAVTAKYNDGNEKDLPLTHEDFSFLYTFTMPAGNTTISADPKEYKIGGACWDDWKTKVSFPANNNKIVKNLVAGNSYKFKIWNETYYNTESKDNYMGTEGQWEVWETTAGCVVTCEGSECFNLNVGITGDYTFTIGTSTDNKPMINIAYPDESYIEYNGQQYGFTQYGNTDKFISADIPFLKAGTDYTATLVWNGSYYMNDNDNRMSSDSHTDWGYKIVSNHPNGIKIHTTSQAKDGDNYNFIFDPKSYKEDNVTKRHLTAVYPSYIAGSWTGQDGWKFTEQLNFVDSIATYTHKFTPEEKAKEGGIQFKIVYEGKWYSVSGGHTFTENGTLTLIQNSNEYDNLKLTPNELDDEYTFTFNKTNKQLTVYYPEAEKFKVQVSENGTDFVEKEIGSTSGIMIHAASKSGYRFTGWETTGDIVLADKKAQTTNVKANSVGTVKATYSNEGFVYFRDPNKSSWGKAHAYFYSGSYWDNNKGSGSKNIQHGPYGMAKLEGSDDNNPIYYFDYKSNFTDWTANIIAFTNNYCQGSDNFNMVQAAYRGDFNSNLPMYVPRDFKTHYLNSSEYYNEGIWMKFNDKESGYDLRGSFNNWTSNVNKFITSEAGPNNFDFYTTVYLEAGTYDFLIYNANNTQYGCPYQTIKTKTDGEHGWKFYEKQGNCEITANVSGDYTFHISLKSGEVILYVTYPMEAGDYRVNYGTGAAIKYSNVIKSGNESGVISLWLPNGKTTLNFEKVTSIAGDGTITWGAPKTVEVTTSAAGVYQMTLTSGGAINDLVAYTGDYFVRTDCANGGWKDYLTNPDNKMHFTDRQPKFVANNNTGYNYYYTKFFDKADGNVRFVIANTINSNLSGIMKGDEVIGDKENLPGQAANIRFTWNSNTNAMDRAYISGSTDVSKRYLVLNGNTKSDSEHPGTLIHLMLDLQGNYFPEEGDGRTNLHQDEAIFTDKGNWVYQIEIKAKPGCAVKLMADYNSQTQYFIGAEGEESGSRKTIMDGTTEGAYRMRAVYDFKTDILVAGWIPDGTEIDADISLGGDMLLVREQQGQASQITFGNAAAQVSSIQQIYGVLELNKEDMTNRLVNEKRVPLTSTSYDRCMYWISFPFHVQLSKVFGGVGGYGTKWIMQKYRGDRRAQEGLFKNANFWEYMDENEYMEPYVGYVLSLNPSYFDEESDEVWQNVEDNIAFYFPSEDKNINIISSASKKVTVPAHPCDIDVEFTVEGVEGKLNHTETDANWNVIGIPAFEDLTENPGERIGVKALYEWNFNTNKYTVVTASDYTFNAMKAYMVQFSGEIDWSNASVITKAFAAPRYAFADYENYMIELFFNGNGAEDHTYINLADEAHTDFVLNEDMMKIDNSGFPNIYSFAGAYNVAYNETKMDNQSVMLGVSAPKDGSYTFAMPKDFSGKAILVDLETGEATDLNLSNYTVELNKGTYNNRFQLLLEVEAKAPTAIDNAKGEWSEDGKTKKLLIRDQIYLINAGRIYNVLGVGE